MLSVIELACWRLPDWGLTGMLSRWLCLEWQLGSSISDWLLGAQPHRVVFGGQRNNQRFMMKLKIPNLKNDLNWTNDPSRSFWRTLNLVVGFVA